MVFFWNNSAQSTKISNVHDNCAKTHVLLIEKQHIRLQMLKRFTYLLRIFPRNTAGILQFKTEKGISHIQNFRTCPPYYN